MGLVERCQTRFRSAATRKGSSLATQPSTPADHPIARTTIESVFEWLLRCAAVASCLFLAQQTLFYLAIRSLDPFPASADLEIYRGHLLITALGTTFNVGAWWFSRRIQARQTLGAFVIAGNSILFTGSWWFVLELYQSLLLPLLIPAFLSLAVFAGLLGRVRTASALCVLLSAEYAGLLFVADQPYRKLPTEVLWLAPATCALMFCLSILMTFVSKRLQRGESRLRSASSELAATNAELERAQALLSRYLAPQLARQIVSGCGEKIARHERRKLTLFFSDIKDFTATTDAMEPEDLASLLNRYLQEMVDIANEHGGTVAQISGDGLFILFGAPEAASDREHALRAVRMAIRMQERTTELQQEWFGSGIETPFEIRCGINTGMATVGGFGSDGRREYTAIGMQTNLAARLEAACTPGKILMSHSTWALVHHEIPCIEQQQISVKGFHRPLRTYTVQSEKP